MKDIEKKKYDTAVENLRTLLTSWRESGIELFMELRKVEQSMVWSYLHKDFETFLRKEFPNALGIVQYRHVIEAIEQHGEDLVRRVGVHACNALISKKFDESPKLKEAFHEVIERETEKNHGVAPDAEWLTTNRRSILSEPKETQAVRGLRRESQLLEENRQLKAQLRQAHARIRELEKQLKMKPKKATRRSTQETAAA